MQNFGKLDEVLFLEISLTENWLIFITRANGPFWSSLPSWQLTGAILVVDVIATFFCLFGFFVGGQTSIVAVVRIWIFSFGVFCVLGGIYYLLQDSAGFDNLMHGKSPKKNQKQRNLEDFSRLTSRARRGRSRADPVYSRVDATCFHTAREEFLEKRYISPNPISKRGSRATELGSLEGQEKDGGVMILDRPGLMVHRNDSRMNCDVSSGRLCGRVTWRLWGPYGWLLWFISRFFCRYSFPCVFLSLGCILADRKRITWFGGGLGLFVHRCYRRDDRPLHEYQFNHGVVRVCV